MKIYNCYNCNFSVKVFGCFSPVVLLFYLCTRVSSSIVLISHVYVLHPVRVRYIF